MTAEEFEGSLLDISNENATERYMMNKYEFAEAYLKAEVDAISDEDIEKQNDNGIGFGCEEAEMEHYVYSLGYENGIKWFKEQLLKQ